MTTARADPPDSVICVGGLLSELGVDIGDDHLGAVLREQPRGRRADTATAAGHHRDPVGQQSAGNRCVRHSSSSFIRSALVAGFGQHFASRSRRGSRTPRLAALPASPSPRSHSRTDRSGRHPRAGFGALVGDYPAAGFPGRPVCLVEHSSPPARCRRARHGLRATRAQRRWARELSMPDVARAARISTQVRGRILQNR